MAYWLLKTEPGTFSWQDLLSQPQQITTWEGVRNYQARNFITSMKIGDQAFFYHSVKQPQVIMGIVRVVKEPYPDYFAFDKDNPYYDPKSSPENPRWFMVDVQAQAEFANPITRERLKEIPQLKDMVLLQKGNRLSVQPVTPQQWDIIVNLEPLIKLRD